MYLWDYLCVRVDGSLCFVVGNVVLSFSGGKHADCECAHNSRTEPDLDSGVSGVFGRFPTAKCFTYWQFSNSVLLCVVDKV